MSLDFLKPDVWDGLVLGTILIGVSLAVLRLMSDRAVYRQEQRRRAENQPPTNEDNQP